MSVKQRNFQMLNNVDRVNLGLTLGNINNMEDYSEFVGLVNKHLKLCHQRIINQIKSQLKEGDWVTFVSKSRGPQKGQIIKINRTKVHVTMEGSSHKYWIVPLTSLKKMQEEK